MNSIMLVAVSSNLFCEVPRTKGMALAPGLATVQWREGKQDLIGIITLQEAETLRRAVQVSGRNIKIEVHPFCLPTFVKAQLFAFVLNVH